MLKNTWKTNTYTHTNTQICICCSLAHMPKPLLLGYFLPQCLESILGVVFVTPVAAHGQMSGCLFISGYKCVHVCGSHCLRVRHTQPDLQRWGRVYKFWSISAQATPKIVSLVLSFYLPVTAFYIHSELSSSWRLSLWHQYCQGVHLTPRILKVKYWQNLPFLLLCVAHVFLVFFF